MEEKESNSAGISLQGNDLSYLKLESDRRTLPDLHYMENDDITTSALELEWDMETELEELGTEQLQSDGFIPCHEKNSTAMRSHTVASNQLSISPKGRFQRLEEEPEYFSHYTESKPKTSQQFCTIVKTFSIFMFTFLIGILIGYFSKGNPTSSSCISSDEPDSSDDITIINEIVKDITKENIEQYYRYFTQISVNKTSSNPAENIALLWTSIGLKEVQLLNYSVLLDLPGSSPNTITLNNGQCYYPSGQQCDEETKSQEYLYTYAAYSANGNLEGEVIDVQYGTVEDLTRVTQIKHISKTSIALLKLGFLPLLYKLSLLEEIGFGGVLVYIDPCDVPETENLKDKEFMVSLKSGGFLSTKESSNYNGNSWEMKPNVTSLLVQPVTISLLRRLFTWTENTMTDQCLPIKVPEKDQLTITLNIRSTQEYKDVSNSIGFLRGLRLPDRYIILGSPHADVYGRSPQNWVSGAATMASIISSIVSKVKTGWRPHRTIVFCSWGGNPYGNFGSYKWGKDLQRILAGNAVAYIGLQNPVCGNGSLRSISSPSLQQLATELAKKMQINCTRKEGCYKANVSSIQTQGNADFFINQLGIPGAQFAFEDKRAKISHIFPEVLLNNKETFNQLTDTYFYLHEYIAKLTTEMVLRIASDPVLPFNALDIALEIQKQIEGHDVSTDIIEMAKHLRETVQWFQSNEMRPANDPNERVPIRVRMLNDVLQNMEKNFLISNSPPGFFRNLLYRLDETSSRISILQEAQEHCRITKSNETLMTALQEVLNSISSAELYFKEGLHLFDSDLEEKE
ncbi:inactive N-acetylated-alpha-linked acidic dipeptidase-like protein 2 isoform X1 [Bufo bufo]|uniref:inactive N-acetylated-alpha-linked acidic dipeptidase-like protein 2 isoform X1 n=2 Tax=Bufo bufo TaxID=8384 RepID=UPI001ABE8C55|nr:inactive N-acetylated-alpha-linked acidic dipeptidase-like protein 2 isoform X1 [Bufo bufo]